jgi:glycerol-1-phosphate dehydrogenase [NAD(P)+]
MPAGDPLELLLTGRYPDPETGELLAASARTIAIEPSLEGMEADLVKNLDLGHRYVVVADVNTQAALGHRVRNALDAQSIILEEGVETTEAVIAKVAAAVDPGVDVVVAVGSGTINDICKMVALGRGCPQVVFATAPSMNGYTSLSASISENGFKRSVRAITPTAAFFDLGVIAAAPKRLIRSGLGDSLARPTAQADWLLQHLLLDRPYREAPFRMLAADEAALLAEPEALLAGDLTAIRHLVRVLVLSGFGMTLSGGSFPASQAEHLISHYVELKGENLPHTFHGEQIAVASVAMARLQDAMLRRVEPPRLRPSIVDRETVLAHFGPEQGEAAWREVEPKLLGPAETEALNERLSRGWPQIRDRIMSVTLGAPRMIEIATRAGVATSPEQLGWPPALLPQAMAHAWMMRNRYTFLDLAAATALTAP